MDRDAERKRRDELRDERGGFLPCYAVPEVDCDARGSSCGGCPAYRAWREMLSPRGARS